MYFYKIFYAIIQWFYQVSLFSKFYLPVHEYFRWLFFRYFRWLPNSATYSQYFQSSNNPITTIHSWKYVHQSRPQEITHNLSHLHVSPPVTQQFHHLGALLKIDQSSSNLPTRFQTLRNFSLISPHDSSHSQIYQQPLPIFPRDFKHSEIYYQPLPTFPHDWKHSKWITNLHQELPLKTLLCDPPLDQRPQT